MLLTLVELVVPALVILTTLFGLLARGNPKPGGVALFLRVGVVALALAGALFFVSEKTAAAAWLGGPAEWPRNLYLGLGGGGAFLVLMAFFGNSLKKR
jgi:hypothetical protein